MIYLAITREGYEELIRNYGHIPSPIWVNNGVLSESELSSLRQSGVDITNFVVTINPEDSRSVQMAVETIKDHHPGHRVWVEYASSL